MKRFSRFRCFYCAKRAVRRGPCFHRPSVGDVDVCGRHFHCMRAPGKNTGIGES